MAHKTTQRRMRMPINIRMFDAKTAYKLGYHKGRYAGMEMALGLKKSR